MFMFALTIDQKSSRRGVDLVPGALDDAQRVGGSAIILGPERTVGDELQLLTPDPGAALTLVLHFTRLQTWSVGVGIGEVEEPLPRSVRSARGSALINARGAVDRAKSDSTRLAIVDDTGTNDAESLLRLLIELRDRRTRKGWEVHDGLAAQLTQREIARRLGITPAAVSLRASAASLGVEEQALPALTRILARADSSLSVRTAAR